MDNIKQYLVFFFPQVEDTDNFFLIFGCRRSTFISAMPNSSWDEKTHIPDFDTFGKMFPDKGKYLSLESGKFLYYNENYYDWFLKYPDESFVDKNRIGLWRGLGDSKEFVIKEIFEKVQEYFCVFLLKIDEEILGGCEFEEFPFSNMEGFRYSTGWREYLMGAYASIVAATNFEQEIEFAPYEGMEVEIIYSNIEQENKKYIEPKRFNVASEYEKLDRSRYQGLISVSKKISPSSFREDFMKVADSIQYYPSLTEMKWQEILENLPDLDRKEELIAKKEIIEKLPVYEEDDTWSHEWPATRQVSVNKRKNIYYVIFCSYNERLGFIVDYVSQKITLTWDTATITHQNWALSPEMEEFWDEIDMESIVSAEMALEKAKRISFLFREVIPISEEIAKVFAFPSETQRDDLKDLQWKQNSSAKLYPYQKKEVTYYILASSEEEASLKGDTI